MSLNPKPYTLHPPPGQYHKPGPAIRGCCQIQVPSHTQSAHMLQQCQPVPPCSPSRVSLKATFTHLRVCCWASMWQLSHSFQGRFCWPSCVLPSLARQPGTLGTAAAAAAAAQLQASLDCSCSPACPPRRTCQICCPPA